MKKLMAFVFLMVCQTHAFAADCPFVSGSFESTVGHRLVKITDDYSRRRLRLEWSFSSGVHGSAEELILDGVTRQRCSGGELMCEDQLSGQGFWIWSKEGAFGQCAIFGFGYVTPNGKLNPGQPPAATISLHFDPVGGALVVYKNYLVGNPEHWIYRKTESRSGVHWAD